MSCKIALALTALLAPIAAHLLWPSAFEETVGCVTLVGSLYWCRTNWKSYVAFMGLLTLALAVTLPLFALVTGLWILAIGGLTLLWEGLRNLNHISAMDFQNSQQITSRQEKQRNPVDDEHCKPIAVLCCNGLPLENYDGSQVLVDIGTPDPFDSSNS